MTSNRSDKSKLGAVLVLICAVALLFGLRDQNIKNWLVERKLVQKLSIKPVTGPSDTLVNAPLVAEVIQVKDGDSFIVKIAANNSFQAKRFQANREIEVRLSSIDAPEYFMPFGRECREQLENLIGNKTINLNPMHQDRYGRTLAIGYIRTMNINRQMVRSGCAWAYRRYLYDGEMIGLEQMARREKIGLWSQEPSKIIPPWQQRKH